MVGRIIEKISKLIFRNFGDFQFNITEEEIWDDLFYPKGNRYLSHEPNVNEANESIKKELRSVA